MLGGLYGDLPPPSSVASSSSGDEEKNNSSSTWSSSVKMAPPALRKPSYLFTPPQSVLKNQQSQGRPKTPQTKIVSPVSTGSASIDDGMKSVSIQPALVGVTTSIVEEYDPAKPNDYEEYRRERRRRLMEMEMKQELERRRQEEEEKEQERKKELERERVAMEKEKESDYESRSASLNISGEEAWKRRAAISGLSAAPRSPSPPNGDGFMIGKSSTAGLGVGAGGQMTAAQKMMAKMGWKEGQGLGKQEQGITTPLMAKKTDRRAGVIVNTSESRADKKLKSVNLNGPPTRVLLLRNMIKGLSNVKEEVYGALDSFIAWDLEFPLITVKKALKKLEEEKEWKRIIQFTKWMLSKGQGKTMGSYFMLLNALAEDGRLEEADDLWSKIFSENLEGTPRVFFDKMIYIYHSKYMHMKMFEVFADMEELGIRPNNSIVAMIGDAFKEVGMLDKYEKLVKKYPPQIWEYRYINGKRARVRTEYVKQPINSIVSESNM